MLGNPHCCGLAAGQGAQEHRGCLTLVQPYAWLWGVVRRE